MRALRVVLEVRDSLERLATAGERAAVGPHVILVRQHVLFHVLLLLKSLVAAHMGTLKGPFVAAHVPIKLAFANKVAVDTNWALKFSLLFNLSGTGYNRSATHVM